MTAIVRGWLVFLRLHKGPSNCLHFERVLSKRQGVAAIRTVISSSSYIHTVHSDSGTEELNHKIYSNAVDLYGDSSIVG